MPTTVDYIFAVVYALELLTAISGFAFFFKRRKFIILRLFAVLAVMGGVSVAFLFVQSPWIYWLRYALTYLIAAAGVLFCTETNGWGVLYCMVSGVATQHLYYRVLSLILSFTPFEYTDIFCLCVSLPMLFFIYGVVFLLFRGPMRENASADYKPTQRVNILLALLILIVAIILHLYEQQYDFIHNDRSLLSAFSAYGTMCCIFTLGLQYTLFLSSELAVQKAVLEQLVEKQKEQYEHSRETIDMINVKCHDMKQQISRLEDRVEQEALDEIKSLIKVYETIYRTGNEVLDVFLSERSLIFERNKVQFDCIADGECISFLKPSEIYALFGNACDNALEALVHLPEEDRMFTLTVREKQGMAVIHTENAYAADLVFEDGLPATTKGDTVNHGFGMRSMRMVVEKYRGELTVNAEAGVFNLNILIPIPAGTEKE